MDQNSELLRTLFGFEANGHSYLQEDLVYERALGSVVWDADGRSYTDLIAGFGSLILGHNHESFKGTVTNSLKKDLVTLALGDVYPGKDKIELLKFLANYLPGELKVGILSLSGAQAVESAIKTAILATGSHGFVSFERAYHGVDFSTLPLTHRRSFSRPFSRSLPSGNIIHLPLNCPLSAVEEAKDILHKSNFGFAGIIVEPVQGRGGLYKADRNWLKGLKTMASFDDVPLIFDEVWTGFGRCGVRFFSDDVEPDIVCLGKALGGGLPLSACFGSSKFMEAWPDVDESIHTGTFFGHPLSCRVGLATLEYLENKNFFVGLAKKVSVFEEALRPIRGLESKVLEVRNLGMTAVIEFLRAGDGQVYMDRLRKQGVLALVGGEKGNLLQFSPALNIPDDKLLEAFAVVFQVLTAG